MLLPRMWVCGAAPVNTAQETSHGGQAAAKTTPERPLPDFPGLADDPTQLSLNSIPERGYDGQVQDRTALWHCDIQKSRPGELPYGNLVWSVRALG